MLSPADKITRRFQLVLVKPSHYDDDGYVIQWWRSSIPSNSLACLYALAADAAARHVLGREVAIDITAMDETNTRVRVDDIIARIRRHGGFGMVGLVGVQSNQFPRALDIARPLRDAGIPVVIGGFHVSGCIAMLPDMQADLKIALDMGCSLFVGECEEGRLDKVVQDAAAGALLPIYNYKDDLPALEGTPTPYLPRGVLGGTIHHLASFDAGRGCPFQCSFCTIINVQGRKSRRRTPDDVARLIKQHWAEGVRRFFITDDNLARNKDWEPIFDRLIELREHDGIPIQLVVQVDTGCHKIPNFIDKARRAGVSHAFVGLESINPDNLMAAKKRQNKITEYRKMLIAWKRAGVITYAGYILGFPHDTRESILRDIDIIKKELPLDILEFFVLTPLPGSEDHQVLWKKGDWMDPDMNKYDAEHVCTAHSRMTAKQWQGIYEEAWRAYYTPKHLMTILRRGLACNSGVSRLQALLVFFSIMQAVENVHPLQAGVLRLKYRRDRRPGLPIQPIWRFYPRYVWEAVRKQTRIAMRWAMVARMLRQARRDQKLRPYTDLALTPVSDETETLEIFTQNEAARNAVAHVRKVEALTHGASAHAAHRAQA